MQSHHVLLEIDGVPQSLSAGEIDQVLEGCVRCRVALSIEPVLQEDDEGSELGRIDHDLGVGTEPFGIRRSLPAKHEEDRPRFPLPQSVVDEVALGPGPVVAVREVVQFLLLEPHIFSRPHSGTDRRGAEAQLPPSWPAIGRT